MTDRSHKESPGADPIEASLIALASRGDRAAFTRLVERRQSWLRQLLRRLCRDSSLADDLAQQVLLTTWRALPALRSTAAFPSWLRRLAINAWLAHLRSAPLTGECGSFEDLAPVESMAGEQMDLDRALAALRREERLCVVLAYAEGMSHQEIAAETGMPLGTVKSHVRRGAARLRTLLAGYQPAREITHAR